MWADTQHEHTQEGYAQMLMHLLQRRLNRIGYTTNPVKDPGELNNTSALLGELRIFRQKKHWLKKVYERSLPVPLLVHGVSWQLACALHFTTNTIFRLHTARLQVGSWIFVCSNIVGFQQTKHAFRGIWTVHAFRKLKHIFKTWPWAFSV